MFPVYDNLRKYRNFYFAPSEAGYNNTVKLHYYAGGRKQNENPRYWQPTAFREILREIVFLM
jgi:hypothetical protein